MTVMTFYWFVILCYLFDYYVTNCIRQQFLLAYLFLMGGFPAKVLPLVLTKIQVPNEKKRKSVNLLTPSFLVTFKVQY